METFVGGKGSCLRVDKQARRDERNYCNKPKHGSVVPGHALFETPSSDFRHGRALMDGETLIAICKQMGVVLGVSRPRTPNGPVRER